MHLVMPDVSLLVEKCQDTMLQNKFALYHVLLTNGKTIRQHVDNNETVSR